MRTIVLLPYLFMAIGLFFGACTVTVAPTPTPTATATLSSETTMGTPAITTTVPPPASGNLTATTLSPSAVITTATTEPSTAPLPAVGTAVTGTTVLTTPAAMTTPSAPPVVPVTSTGAITSTLVATGTIFQVISATPNLQTLASVLNAAGMAEALQLPGPFTLFAPTDDAFAALPAEQEEALLNDPAALAGVLQYHVVIDQVSAAQLAQLGAALASSGQTIITTVQADGSLLINTARIVQADVVASNGTIHLIDQLLIPPAQ